MLFPGGVEGGRSTLVFGERRRAGGVGLRVRGAGGLAAGVVDRAVRCGKLSRALRVLQQAGLITLDASVDPAKAGVNNIAENPRGLSFQQVNAEVLPTVLDSVDVAVINGNYAIGAGLDLADAAYVEQLSEGYYNVIAVQGADADAEFAQAVKGIVQSDAFKSVIDDPDNIFAGFGKPSSY